MFCNINKKCIITYDKYRKEYRESGFALDNKIKQMKEIHHMISLPESKLKMPPKRNLSA